MMVGGWINLIQVDKEWKVGNVNMSEQHFPGYFSLAFPFGERLAVQTPPAEFTTVCFYRNGVNASKEEKSSNGTPMYIALTVIVVNIFLFV